MQAGTRYAPLISWMLFGALSAHAGTLDAQTAATAPEPNVDAREPFADAQGPPPERDPEGELAHLRGAVEQARFDDAESRARALLARSDLRARQRNDTLELLAVAQIARRDDVGAHTTLGELFARDPEHPQRLRDPGPSVEAMFARARAEPRPALAVALTSTALATDAQGRALLQVSLGVGRDAVDSVHVFTRVVPEREQSHVVAEVGLREHLAIALPVPRDPVEPGAGPPRLELYVEGRAPSGVVIGRDGNVDAPLVAQLNAVPPCPSISQPARVRGPWWLWTSVAIVIAGVSVSGALIVSH